MVEFLKVQYRLNRITETQLNNLIIAEKITEEDKIYIMN